MPGLSRFVISLALCVAASNFSTAQTLTTVLAFDITNGSGPRAPVIQATDGNFYGTTLGGGANSMGTVFKLTPGGVVTTLYNFCSQHNCTDGSLPYAGLVQGSDGSFYGATQSGGTNSSNFCNEGGCGTLFRVTPQGVFTTLYNFCSQPNCADGDNPQGTLIQASDGNFYGTTIMGGANLQGSVFRVTPSGALTTLYSFCSLHNCADGNEPIGGLVQANDGNLYGTTSFGGGTTNGGTVFRLTLDGALTTIYGFCSSANCPGGGGPWAPLIQGTDGQLYGTTAGIPTAFKITLAGSLTILHHFDGTDGAEPFGGLVQATDGNLYGTTYSGGQNVNCEGACGTIFEVSPQGVFNSLYSFCAQMNCSDGTLPWAGLIQATDGKLYGTTADGGIDCQPVGCGTVFSFNVALAPFVETQPLSGQVGAPVSILGANLTGATSVTFNGTPASFTIQSPTTITTNIPSGATTGTVQVATPSGTLNSNADFQVVGPLQLVPVSPCRLVDTRASGGPIQGGTSRNFNIPSLGGCGIPSNAGAYSLNVTAVPHGRLGYLTIWPEGEIQPSVSTMNSTDGRVKANAAIVPAANNAVSVYASDTTDVILDINGYLAPPSAETYQFYPLTPCRIVDTRNGQHGGTLQAGVERDYAIAGNCGVPPEAIAYSFNVTVLPTQGSLDYLTVWPQGETMPVVSTLNDNTGTIVANAAVVPAGANNTTAFYAHNLDTDLLVDIDGYFAVPGSGGLSLYPMTPCRVLDTRQNNGQPFQGEKTVDVVGSVCAPPANAKAYVFNATVAPPGPMPYLTLWPDAEQRPTVSTLNAFDGFVTSNMAIVPTNNGSIDAYAAALTHLILDISGYFAP